MPLLHDDGHRAALKARLAALRPDSTRQWGKMTIDQMVWHVHTALKTALGRHEPTPGKAPLPPAIMRFIVINLPWPKSGPTNPSLRPNGHYDFERERAGALDLIDELAQKDIAGKWPSHPMLGQMTGRQVSRLQAKHVDHHLRQFGV